MEQPVVPMSDEETGAEVSKGVEAAARRLDLSKARTEIFAVGYTIDYGYTFTRSKDPDKLIEPVFIDFAPQMEMNNSYEQLINRPDIVGKGIFCECEGVSFRLYDSEFFRVTKVRLYVQ